jgi:hypothetical protein
MVISLKHVGLIYPLYTYLRMWNLLIHVEVCVTICYLGHMSTFDSRHNCKNQVIEITNIAPRIRIANQE